MSLAPGQGQRRGEGGRSIPVPRPRRNLTDAQRLAWLRLVRSENVGPVTFRELINQFGGAEVALEALPDLSSRGGRQRSLRICGADEAERELAAAEAVGARLVAIDEAGYPPLLAVIEAPPPLLYVSGRADLLDRPILAMVGARDASAAGRRLAGEIATGLGRAGLVVASGLARGIDTAAHQAALATGTVAVVAGGIDVAYPPENADLQRAIAREGLLIAECAPGLSPRGKDFPRRNRLISGMAEGVLVVEAAVRSGSRITADYAREQGRKLFAVPGNPLDPRAGGTNALLKAGATLVTDAADVLGALAPAREAPAVVDWVAEAGSDEGPFAPPDIAATDRDRVLEALGPAPCSLDDLLRATSLSVHKLRAVLLELDIAGRLERSGGQRFAIKP